MSTLLIQTSELGTVARCSSVNQLGSLMATVHPAPAGDRLSIHTSDQGTGWVPSNCSPDDLLSKELLPGEQLIALDWAHPQFGNLLAVGTSHGRVLLVTNRPSITERFSVELPKWHLCCVLLGIDKIRTKCKVTTLSFAPCDAGLLLVAAHDDGQVRVASCSEVRLGHKASSWPCLHSLNVRSSALLPQKGAKRKCADISWQPRPHAQQPFLAVASSDAVSVWFYDQLSVAWTCVCEDLEERAQIYHKREPIVSVAWAPLMARKVECIAVARGGMVRLLGLGGQLQGHINANENLQAYQIGEDVEHEAPVWQVQWSNLGMDLAVSCSRTSSHPAAVHIHRVNLLGELEPDAAAMIVAKR